ncbi:MAG: MBL fold metallo-hydrolase [Planctomycetes bacterium]|nr:MBL fold metallo-hydrolase [Planctomycetota bacterium]
MQFHIISIGALAANPLWNERAPQRTGHATTTLIISDDRRILVDPGLPAQALTARLSERVNLKPDDITDIFLTHLLPDTTRGMGAFQHARWWIAGTEREQVGIALASQAKRLKETGEEPAVLEALGQDIAILQRCKAAPDHIADRVDLFPLPGVTPGHCGLLLSHPRFTVVVAGDAVPTAEHLEQGKVLPVVADVQAAKESLQETVEIADLIIPGRDNIMVNPTKRAF